jgi:hypothetical protein
MPATRTSGAFRRPCARRPEGWVRAKLDALRPQDRAAMLADDWDKPLPLP